MIIKFKRNYNFQALHALLIYFATIEDCEEGKDCPK